MKKLKAWLKLQEEGGEEWVLARDKGKSLGSEILLASLSTASKNSAPTPPLPPSPPASQASAVSHPIFAASLSDLPLLSTDWAAIKPAAAQTLEELKAKLQAFEGCALKKLATQMVFADGNHKSPLLFVGEAPGLEEDKQGLPFVGASGQLLNKMMAAIGLTRENVYITNVVNWRPPGNRPPTLDEITQCLPFLKRHIELIAPQCMVLLGATAMKAVLNVSSSLSKARGTWHAYKTSEGTTIPTLVTFHPSYLLRSPNQKPLAWQDLLLIQKRLQGND
ncbi:hypothetical protein AGMMS49949_04250 [Alphaproteobacteria bacterium]|nr:hypothetical protein AGMMS49949_04250 [Alphaproteobacteria bacterium]GHS96810.1 hypothetical protein AGMMS50296_3280 [Alphaproteobacteria bacterium]